jgi:hypothetical protein
MTDSRLLRCPYCGKPAELYQRTLTYSTKKVYIPRCTDRLCCGRTTHYYEDEEKAVEMWNRRASVNETLKCEQWIPCSQEQPKEKGTYLVTVHEWSDDKDNFPDYDYQKVMRMRYSIEDGWRVPTHCPEWINKVMHEDVLAWKIMPEPYKESSEVKK